MYVLHGSDNDFVTSLECLMADVVGIYIHFMHQAMLVSHHWNV